MRTDTRPDPQRRLSKPHRFPAPFDTVLADAGIEVVLSGVRIPRMNSITEWWAHTCRCELLHRTLIWNQRHLLHALREFEEHCNCHRPHQGIANARPLDPSLPAINDPDKVTHLDIQPVGVHLWGARGPESLRGL